MAYHKQKISLCVIGDEVLKGEVSDENTRFFIREFNNMGVEVAMAAVIPDEVEVISNFIKRAVDEVDYVVITGGIGPTPDDVTREAVAMALGVPLVIDLAARETLESYYGQRIHEARLKMAMVPENSTLIPNPMSAAPGFITGKVIVFPGIPELIEIMFPFVKQFFRKVPVRKGTVFLSAGESTYSDIMSELMGEYKDLSVGSYPSIKKGYRARVVIRGNDIERVKKWVEDFEDKLGKRRIDVEKKMFE